MAVESLVPSRWLSDYVDIMLEILRFFDDREWACEHDGPEVERTSALARLAQTCKAFFGFAIPILWRKLRSPYPLLSLVGSLATAEGQSEYNMDSHGTYPPRWLRFRAYTAYIIELEAIDVDLPLDPSVWLLSQRLTCGRPLLPNLAHLQWCMTSAQHTALVHLVSPSLKKLVVHCSISKQHLTQAERNECAFALWMPLSAALRVASQLTHVSLTLSGASLPTVLSPISRSRSLQSFQLCVDSCALSIHTYNLALFQPLERLEDLDVNFELAPFTDMRESNVDSFRTLRSLAISHVPGSDPCYSIFASSPLTSLTIHRYRCATLADFRQTCAIWARHFPSLHRFSCDLAPASAPALTAPPSMRLAATIAPLLRLRGMREFALTSSFTVLDNDLIDVTQSWPRLTSFALVVIPSREPPWDAEGPGARSLEAFRRHCPALVRLWLPHLVLSGVDVHAGKQGCAVTAREGQGAHGHGLRELVVRWIDADDYRRAAALVDRTFPHLGRESRAALWGDVLGKDASEWEEDEVDGRDGETLQSSCYY